MDAVQADDESWFPRLALNPGAKGIIIRRGERRPESGPCLASG